MSNRVSKRARFRAFRFAPFLVFAVAPALMGCPSGPMYIDTLVICGSVTLADGTHPSGQATFGIEAMYNGQIQSGSAPVTLDASGYGCASGSPGLGAQEGDYELKSITVTLDDGSSVEGWLTDHKIDEKDDYNVSLELDANFDFRNPNDGHSGLGEVASALIQLLPGRHGAGPASISDRRLPPAPDAVAIGEPSGKPAGTANI